MEIEVQANTGSLYEIMVDPEHSSRLAEANAAFQAGWQTRLLQSPLLLGVKRSWRGLVSMSANDP